MWTWPRVQPGCCCAGNQECPCSCLCFCSCCCSCSYLLICQCSCSRWRRLCRRPGQSQTQCWCPCPCLQSTSGLLSLAAHPRPSLHCHRPLNLRLAWTAGPASQSGERRDSSGDAMQLAKTAALIMTMMVIGQRERRRRGTAPCFRPFGAVHAPDQAAAC